MQCLRGTLGLLMPLPSVKAYEEQWLDQGTDNDGTSSTKKPR